MDLQGSSPLWVQAFQQDRMCGVVQTDAFQHQYFRLIVKNTGAKCEGGLFSGRGKEKLQPWLPCTVKLLLLLRQQRKMSAVRRKGREICLDSWRQLGWRKKINQFQERRAAVTDWGEREEKATLHRRTPCHSRLSPWEAMIPQHTANHAAILNPSNIVWGKESACWPQH